jgi:hypothetical protein
LIIGLSGAPVWGSRLIELKASPLGSTPYPASHEIASTVSEGRGINERLGDRLDGEQLLGITDGIGHAVHGGEADAQPVGVGLGEFGDVACHLATVQSGKAAVKAFEVRLDRGLQLDSFMVYATQVKASREPSQQDSSWPDASLFLSPDEIIAWTCQECRKKFCGCTMRKRSLIVWLRKKAWKIADGFNAHNQ